MGLSRERRQSVCFRIQHNGHLGTGEGPWVAQRLSMKWESKEGTRIINGPKWRLTVPSEVK
jgi:hypothetical protein